MKNKNENKKMSPFKKLLILLIVILLIFAGINLSWYFFKFRPYKQLAENFNAVNIGDNEELQRYSLEKDGYYFNIKMPAYLGFEGGYCRVSTSNGYEYAVDIENDDVDESKVIGLTLYYYPRIFQEDQYAIFIETSSDFTPLDISKDLKYIPAEGESKAETEDHENMIRENFEEIEKLMNEAISVWG